MSKQTINIGASPNDGTGTPLRTSFDYTNQNFTELYNALGGGVGLPGSANQIIFNNGSSLAGDADLFWNSTLNFLTVTGSAIITADLTVDGGTLKVDSTNNFVGINKTPVVALDVSGSATITGALTVDTTTLVVDAANDNVIVGATSAIGSGRFSVQADLSAKQAICAKNSAASYSATNNFIRFTNSTDSTVGGITHPAVTSLGVWGVSDIQFLLSGAGTTAMTLNSTGLAVGTASATYKLDLLSTSACQSRIRSTGNGQTVGLRIESKNSDGTDCQLLIGSGVVADNEYNIRDTLNTKNLYRISGISASSNSHLWFTGSATASMTLDTSGNLLVGTTTNTNSSRVFARGTASNSALALQGATGDVALAQLTVGKFDNNTTTSQVFVRFTINDNSGGSGQINANGASQAAFGSFSDSRLKENILSLPSQLANILSLRPVEFDYKDGSGHQIGFVAQEMQEIYSDTVGEQNGFLTVTGWSKTEARLVSAIKELAAKVQALEAKLA